MRAREEEARASVFLVRSTFGLVSYTKRAREESEDSYESRKQSRWRFYPGRRWTQYRSQHSCLLHDTTFSGFRKEDLVKHSSIQVRACPTFPLYSTCDGLLALSSRTYQSLNIPIVHSHSSKTPQWTSTASGLCISPLKVIGRASVCSLSPAILEALPADVGFGVQSPSPALEDSAEQ